MTELRIQNNNHAYALMKYVQIIIVRSNYMQLMCTYIIIGYTYALIIYLLIIAQIYTAAITYGICYHKQNIT